MNGSEPTVDQYVTYLEHIIKCSEDSLIGIQDIQALIIFGCVLLLVAIGVLLACIVSITIKG